MSSPMQHLLKKFSWTKDGSTLPCVVTVANNESILSLKKLHVLACHRDDIPKFAEAAIRFKINLQIVLDEVPLHYWHAILRTPSPRGEDKLGQEFENIPDVASEQDETLNIENVTPQKNSSHQTFLKGKDIRVAASAFLRGWLQGVLGPAGTRSASCLI